MRFALRFARFRRSVPIVSRLLCLRGTKAMLDNSLPFVTLWFELLNDRGMYREGIARRKTDNY